MPQESAAGRHAGGATAGTQSDGLGGAIGKLEERKILFESLTEEIEIISPAGRLVFHLFDALAEFERNVVRERTTAGFKAARPFRRQTIEAER